MEVMGIPEAGVEHGQGPARGSKQKSSGSEHTEHSTMLNPAPVHYVGWPGVDGLDDSSTDFSQHSLLLEAQHSAQLPRLFWTLHECRREGA